jgi:hypothetical protein
MASRADCLPVRWAPRVVHENQSKTPPSLRCCTRHHAIVTLRPEDEGLPGMIGMMPRPTTVLGEPRPPCSFLGHFLNPSTAGI